MKYTDEQLKQMIRASAKEREDAVEAFFKDPSLRTLAAKEIKRLGGQDQDVDNTFQKAFIVFYRKIMKGEFEGRSSLRTFFIGICKNKWMDNKKNAYTRNMRFSENTEDFDRIDQESPEKSYLIQERQKILQQILALLSKKCKLIISLWSKKYSANDIVEILGLPENYNVRNAKYKCMEGLKAKIPQNPAIERLLNSLRYE